MADVRMPDGTIIRNVPEGTTRAQLSARYGKSQSPASAKHSVLSDLAAGFNPKTMLSNLNEGLIGGAEGVYNAASAITDPIVKKAVGLIYGDDAANAAMSQANRGRKGASDAASHALVSNPNSVARTTGRIGGAMAIPLPGKKLQEGGKVARAAYRALQGAVGGAAVRDVDADAAEPALIGAAANVALPPVLSWAANTAPGRAVSGAVAKVARPLVNYLTGGGDEAVAALAAPTAARPLAPLGRKAEVRAARFQKLGVENPTTGMVTRDPNAFSFEQNTAKTAAGEDLQKQMAGVESTLVEKGKQLVRDAGGVRGPEVTGKSVQDALDAKRTEMQQVTGRLYDSVRDTRGDEIVGTLDNLQNLMGDPDMTDNATFDQMRDSLSRRMARLGFAEGAEGQVSVKQAEELRKFIRGLGSTIDPAVRMMRSKMVDALDDDVVATVGDDAFQAARASAKARFDEFSKTFAGRIADERIAPEQLTKRVLSDTTSLTDLRAMRESLLSGTEGQMARGKEAWQGLRSQALGDLMEKSIDADGHLIGSKLSAEFVKPSQQAKWRELLDPADYKELRRLVLATRDVKSYPQGHSVNTSNTATTLANMFEAAKPKVQEGWVKFIAKLGAKHAGAAAVSFPFGNVALVVGENVTGTIAQRKAAEVLARRVQMAQNPAQTASAIAAMKSAARSNPIAADFLKKYGVATGGAGAAVAGEAR